MADGIIAGQVAERAITTAPYYTAGGTVILGLTANELGVMVGVAATVISTGVNWHYQRKKYLLALQQAGGDE